MNTEIITTGTELLLGEILDTNATHIARQLRDIGVNLFYKTTVGDNRQRLADVLRHGLQRSDVLVVTGGLGPTVDDVTRESVSDATGLPLEQRPELVETLAAQFAAWGRPMSVNNLRQTYLPAGSTVIPNPVGTAPGFAAECEQGVIICMPGVPREMKRMMTDWVLPYLQERSGSASSVIHARILHTAGIGESTIDDRLGHLMTLGNPTVGLAAHLGSVDIRLTARAGSVDEAQALIAPVEVEIREMIGTAIYAVDDQTLSGVVADLLREAGKTLALEETNTAGRIASEFGEQASDVLLASDHHENLFSLSRSFDLDHVSLNENSAIKVAQALRERSGADCALAVLGSQEAAHGFWNEERGETWFALATEGKTIVRHLKVGGQGEFSGQWLTTHALNLLRTQLLEGC